MAGGFKPLEKYELINQPCVNSGENKKMSKVTSQNKHRETLENPERKSIISMLDVPLQGEFSRE